MDFGLVLQTDPPAWRQVELAKRAEHLGFSHVWTFDSHVLWQEPYVIYSQILAATHRVTVGPMVTNPATRDWTVTASLFATLNDMFGNRTVCGIGRGDSALRFLGGKPHDAGHAARVDPRHPRAGQRAQRSPARTAASCASRGSPSRSCRCGWRRTGRRRWRWRRGGRRVHPAARRPRHRGLDDRLGTGGRRRRRPRPRRRSRSASPRRPTSATTCRTSASSAAGSAAWSATTSPTSSPATASGRHHPDGADRLHQGPRGLRLHRARPGGQHPHRLRARRDRRPLLRPRPGRGTRREAATSSRRWASTSSRSTSCTTSATRRSPPTATW